MSPQDFLDAVGRRPVWQDDGLCAQTDPAAFYPELGESTRPAKRVCLACPVSTECLKYALDNKERFGIWGGTSERERRKLWDKRVRVFGPSKDDPHLIEHVLILLGDGTSVLETARIAGTSARTVRRIRDAQENGAAA